MLEVAKLTKCFGVLVAVKDLTFTIKEGEIVGLIGPNGAGKTTLFNLICGVYRPDSGEIKFLDHDVTGLPPHKICRLGISRTHQIVRPFLDMTVIENVMVGLLYGAGERLSNVRSVALELLKFVGLENKKDVPARNLNLFERKVLEMARSLATKPRLLLLDEPVSGLTSTEIEEATKTIRRIRDELGITVFWVEHVMKAIKGTVERIIVMNYGEKIAEGTFEEISNNEKVIDAYLGEKYLF